MRSYAIRKSLIVLSLAALVGLPLAVVAASEIWEVTGEPGYFWPAPDDEGVVLADGRVLLTGGGSNFVGAEIYDPATGGWSPAANMLRDQSDHVAVRLTDGRVLVAGGCTPFFYCSSDKYTEIYNPVTDNWSVAAPMLAARLKPAATLLADGRVLVLGAGGGYPPVNPSAEIYDPVTNTWSATGPMVTNRSEATATLLNDGRVLVVGVGNSTELYNSSTNTWSATGSLQTARIFHEAVLLNDGRVLIVGGSLPGASISAELFDTSTGTWSPAANLNVARTDGHTATVLLNGSRVLVAGGFDAGQGKVLDSAEIYDPSTDTWILTAPMNVPRLRHFAAMLATGRVLVVSGSTAELFIDATEVDNIAPVADAGPDQRVNDSNNNGFETVTLDGSASFDPLGVIVSYEWKEGSTVLGNSVVITTNLSVGQHNITLTVTDDGNLSDSDNVSITVNPATVDTVTITRAVYRASNSALLVEATSRDPNAELTAVGYGVMTKKGSKWTFRKTGVPDPSATVTVTSSSGGSATANVKHI